MKILITGAHGYIATNLCTHLQDHGMEAVCRSVRGELPDFSGYDAVVHCAGIVHTKAADAALYNAVNQRLTVAIARSALNAHVPRFIFLSTMAVYGDKVTHIDRNTPEDPCTDYGWSKWEAEIQLEAIAQKNPNHFYLSILRPPMVYGENCPGNYARLEKFAKLTPIFPKVKNERSALHISTLCEFVRLLLCAAPQDAQGIFFPQDAEYMCTSDEVKKIRMATGKKIWLSAALGWLVKRLPLPGFKKIFGSLTYAKSYETFTGQYR